MQDNSALPQLSRSLGLPLVTLYGVGVTVGAGIYVLVGEVAGVAGMAAPLAFLLAGILAGLSAFSYSELSVRLPQSGGEAAYVDAAFGRGWLTLAVGLLVAFSGITSSGAVILGFVGYLQELVAVPGWMAIAGIVLVLGGVTFWGVRESVMLVAATTVIEIGGLLLVVIWGAPSLAGLGEALPQMWPGLESTMWLAALSASVLAFFAFIGFEDIVNMAEESRNVSRTLPRAILLTLFITLGIYLLLTLVAVLTVPAQELAGTAAPLALVFERSGGNPAVLSSIAVLAVINGALIQIIMASRLLYGMARLGRLPGVLARVNARTHTPDVAIGVVMVLVAFSTWGLPIAALAGVASLAVLTVFTFVNGALLRFKLSGVPAPDGTRTVPLWVPVLGMVASGCLLAFGLWARVAG